MGVHVDAFDDPRVVRQLSSHHGNGPKARIERGSELPQVSGSSVDREPAQFVIARHDLSVARLVLLAVGDRRRGIRICRVEGRRASASSSAAATLANGCSERPTWR